MKKNFVVKWPKQFLIINFLLSVLIGPILAHSKTEPLEFSEFVKAPFVSLGFASANLDSVISSFGHTFLVFHNTPVPKPHSIVYEFYGDLSVDYYLLRSLTGLPGHFKFSHFQDKRLGYGKEKRNLWLFRLKLNSLERETLNRIVMEQRRKKSTYYFLTKNCSWYIYQTLIKSFENKNCHNQFYTAPMDTIVWLNQCGRLKKSFLIKSSANSAQKMYKSLNPIEKQKMNSIDFQEKPDISAFSNKERQFLSNFLNNKIPETRHLFMRNHMIKWKLKLAPHIESLPLIKENKFTSEKTSSVHLGFNPINESFLFGFYPALLFFERNPQNHFWTDELKMFSFDFILNQKQIFPGKITLFELNTKQPKTLINKGFVRIIKLGYDRFQFKKYVLEQSVFRMAEGKAWTLLPGFKISGFIGGEAGYYKKIFRGFSGLPFLRAEMDLKLRTFIRMNLFYENYLISNKFKSNQINFRLSFMNRPDFSLSLDSTVFDSRVFDSRVSDSKTLDDKEDNIEIFLRINYLFN